MLPCGPFYLYLNRMTLETLPEAWMRGPRPGVHPLLAPVLFSFQQAQEDLRLHTADLTPNQVWARPFDLAPLGFHLRHIAGSIDRLTAYLERLELSSEQLLKLSQEAEPGTDCAALLNELDNSIARATQVIIAIDVSTLTDWRGVGRKQLPTTVIGLLIHIAEHTQRHVGQAIAAAQLVRSQVHDQHV